RTGADGPRISPVVRAHGVGEATPCLDAELFGTFRGRDAGSFELLGGHGPGERSAQHLASLAKCPLDQVDEQIEIRVDRRMWLTRALDEGRVDSGSGMEHGGAHRAHDPGSGPECDFDRWDTPRRGARASGEALPGLFLDHDEHPGDGGYGS